MLRMKILNKDSKIKNQEVGADIKMKLGKNIKMNIPNKIQAKGKSDMFKSRGMFLKLPNLIKMGISKPEKVVISNISLINLIVGGRIEVDSNTVVVMKVVVEVIMIIIATTSKILGK